MKNNISRISILFLGVLCTVVTQDALAVGTPAGTVIQTRSRVTYTSASGAAVDTAYSDYVNFTVAQVAAVNITPATNAVTTESDSVYVAYALTITNSGNGPDQYTLSSTSTKGWTRAMYFDANGDGTLQPAEISAGAITQTASVEADASYMFFVRVFAPRDPSLDGQTDTTVVTAASVFDNTKSNSAQARTTVHTANFTNITSGLTVTPSNPSPGDNVVYTITITNSGNGAATGLSFSDHFDPLLFTFVSGSTTQGEVNTAGNPVIWNAGTLNPGSSVTVSITLKVNSGLTLGTVLNNTIDVTYSVGGSTFTVTTNNPPAAIGVIRGVEISPLSVSAAAEPEDTLVYPFIIKNSGNTSDVLELEYASSNSYLWTFYKDVNQNDSLDAGDTQLVNTNGSSGVDVDSVAALDSVQILARLVVPAVPSDQFQEVTSFTVRSAVDAAKAQTATGTTTFNVAGIVLVRSVAPEGNQPPETEMTFTVSYQNTGHGTAYNVTVTETEADSMTYSPNSVSVNGVAKTDAADGDEVTVTTVSGRKIITILLGTLNGQTPAGIITYKATIN
ncbi:MAG: hypothetical protein WCW40_07315 [Bacteroidota bacterium]